MATRKEQPAVAQQDETALAVIENRGSDIAPNIADLPDFMKDLVGSTDGMDDFKSGDMTLPRLALAQSSSPQIKEGNRLYIEDLRAGQFFNTLTKEIYGHGREKPLLITPLFGRPHRRKFGPRDAGSPTLCMSPDAETGGVLSPQGCKVCKFSQFGRKEDGSPKRPDCTLFFTYFVILHLPGRMFMPMAFSLKSSALTAAKDWNALQRLRRLPAYTGVYALNSVPDQKGADSFYNIVIKNAGTLADEQTYKDAKALFDDLYAKRADMHEQFDQTGVSDEVVNEGQIVDDEKVPF